MKFFVRQLYLGKRYLLNEVGVATEQNILFCKCSNKIFIKQCKDSSQSSRGNLGTIVVTSAQNSKPVTWGSQEGISPLQKKFGH